MVSLTEVENSVPFNKDEIDSPVKYITLADAEKTRPMPFDYKRGTFERFQSGIISGIESIKDIPQQIEIFGNEVSYTLSGFGGDKEEINRKKSNLDTAIRNLEEVQKERDRYSSRAEQESLAFGVGAGVPSYAIALAGGYVGGSVAAVLGATEKGITAAATATGLVSMAPQQFGSEVQQKLPRTEEDEIDYQKITPEWAMKAEGGAVVATAVNLVLEKKLGFGEQIKIWRMPIKFGKSTTTNIVRGLAKGGITAVSEGMTEGLQDLASYGVSLIDGTATISELPEQLQQSLKSAIIGGILGGTVGTSVAIHEGYNFRKQMRDMIAPVVQDVKKAEQIADAIYNSANDTMTNVISKELELDSQLKARRGNVYNSMLKAVSKAIDKSGGYTGLTEEQKAQHATEVANMFADQALVEANKRGVLIEDVVNAKDIVYQNGEIRFAPKTTVKRIRQYHPERMNLLTYLKYKGGLKDVGGELKSMDAGKQVINTDSGNPGSDYWVFYNIKTKGLKGAEDYYNDAIEVYEQSLKDWPEQRDFTIKELNQYKEGLKKIKSLTGEEIKELTQQSGQVHEVDIPENPYLLDEDATYFAQPEIVRNALDEVINNLTDEQISKEFEGTIYPENRDALRRMWKTGDYDFRNEGGDIYKSLSKMLGSKKAASQMLEKYGIKGITYEGRQDGRCFVIFNPEDVRVIQKFYQGGSIKRGSFNEKSKVIKLFKDANTSTLPHELAHYWLDNMFSYVKSGAASVDYLNQFKAVKDFLEIKDNQEFLTRQQQEKFASGYEKYIHRGIIPNSIMGNVYAGYERWLRDVYDSIEDIKAQGKLPFKLTPEIIKFFDSMLTGGLGEVATTEVADIARLEETQEADNEVTKEAKEVIDAKPIKQTTELLPVKSEGEVKESRLYERMKDLGDAEDSLGYNEVTIEEQREKAQKLWQNNPEQAQSILNDVNFSNDILRNAVYTEQQRLALENGDSDTFLESLRKQSAEATRIGQELSALRGVFDDITMPSYWIRQAENEAHKQLAKKMTSYLDRLAGKTSLESLTKQLDDDINSLTKEMLASDDKVKTLSDGIKELKEKYKGLDQKDVELYQEEFTNEEEARKYVEKKAKEAIGLYLTDEQANNIIQMASNLDKMSGKFDKFGVPSEKFFAEKAKLEKAVNEHTPTSQVKVLISTIGRANMLTAPATSVLNVVSSLENYAIQKMLRYINNNVTNHTNDNIVDSNLTEEYRKKLWGTFWNTGYDASTMRSLTDTKLYKGESVTHSEGDGAIREIGRFAEKYVFSRLISSPDIYFKSMRGFTDYIGNEATDIAYKEGLTGEKAKKRANDLFLDATRIEPQTEEGKLIRQKAQTEAAVITYQQDTELSKNLLKLRDLINKGTGDIGIGDILSPFVKTPANILSMGYDATVGAFGHPKNLIQALNDLRSGNLQSDALQTAIRQTTNQVLAGVLISVILSTLIDDDDYIPDYSQLSQRERNAVREAGGTFGSVKIGNTYISTDFFGPLEMPLVAWLNARRAKGLTEKASAFGGAVIREFLDAPVIRDTISSSKSLENIGSGHLELEEALYNYLGDTISSRLTPNLLNVFAKITDDYERKAGKSIIDKLKARTPILREQLPAQVSMATGKPIETQSAWLQILFGARAKEERNSVLAKEFMRLSKTGNGASISDPTKYGDLRTLPDDMKPRVLQDFSAMYSKEANRIIKLASYRKASDDDKKSMLDKARRKVTKEIKQKYKKYLKKKK